MRCIEINVYRKRSFGPLVNGKIPTLTLMKKYNNKLEKLSNDNSIAIYVKASMYEVVQLLTLASLLLFQFF